MWQGWRYVLRGQAYGMDGSMWQGVGVCGRVWGYVVGHGGRLGGHVARVGICGRGQAYGMDGDMWQGVGACSRVWGHVAMGWDVW